MNNYEPSYYSDCAHVEYDECGNRIIVFHDGHYSPGCKHEEEE